MKFKLGDMVELDGLLCSVVGLPDGGDVPEEHLAVWFGDPACKRTSEGGTPGKRPEIWTVPEEYFKLAAPPEFKH